MPAKNNDGDGKTSTVAKRASKLLGRVAHEMRPCAVPGMILQVTHLWSVADTQRETVRALKNAANSSRARRLNRIDLPALARPARSRTRNRRTRRTLDVGGRTRPR